ncbi:MAG: molybdenum cofactor guanylyltransferase [Candidatus Hadarchaeum sp.]|uniref:molybdenum cofactor guanylyltransferase n=1 Tax=Candidatus Hadarchaeum sp. TaxID=2883567 RepID=UPI003D128951
MPATASSTVKLIKKSSEYQEICMQAQPAAGSSPTSGGKIALLILAGGDSKRMGCCKAFYPVSGQPMIKLVFDRIKELSNETIISCKKYWADFAKMFPEAKVIADRSLEEGPIIGLLSALPEVVSDYVAVLACDCPWTNPDVITFLYGRAKGHDGAMLRWPNGFIEPLQAVYRTKKLLAAATAAKKEGKNRLGEVVNFLDDIVYVAPEELTKFDPDLISFTNINSPEDLQKHGEILRKGK